MSYDPTNSSHGRAQVPGQTGEATGRASVGRASVGPVGGADPAEEVTGRAAVPGQAGVTGRAQVGRASVGRASVSARAAHGTPQVDPSADILENAGRADGGPSRDPDRLRAKRKRRSRRNIIMAGTAVFLMLAGIGIVGVTYYFDDVEVPENLGTNLKQTTLITFADGSTMARLGDQNRTIVTIAQISKPAQQAVIAAEDMTFETNDGVDYKGMLRALVNNATGGQRQGASTITQQYARQVLDNNDVTYARKAREAVLAIKIKQNFTNDKIMEMYLNTVPFGRHAEGIEAAASAYFNKSAKDLTLAEGMVLAGCIKQPYSAGGAAGSPYDPTVDQKSATDRFNYIKKNLVELHTITEQEAAALQYPAVTPYDPKNPQLRAQFGLTSATGLVVHHVMDEITKLKNPDGTPRFSGVRNAGLKIVTTIDKNMQAAAENAADPSKPFFKSLKFRSPEKLQAALVAVEPGTGKVKAYYGGPNGSGTDYAGVFQDPVLGDGKWSQGGAHPPGSSMKVYTLAAGIIDGYTIDSIWDGTSPMEFPKSDRVKSKLGPVKNSSTANCQKGTTACMLWEATYESLNTPFYALTEIVTPAKVIEVARNAGIRYMWTDKDEQIDLQQVKDAASLKKYFSTEVGIGQYAVTPLEHAGGIATIAARGQAAQTHFIDKVYKNGQSAPVWDGAVKAKPVPGLTSQMTDNMSWALSKVVDEYRVNLPGRDAAGKSGTWQLGKTQDNAHGWFVGYTGFDAAKNIRGLASAVWLGSKAELQSLEFQSGKRIIGGNGSGQIWAQFMKEALKNQPKASFSGPKDVGSKNVGNGVEPQPSAPTDPNQPGWPGNGPGQPSTEASRRGNNG